MSYPTHNSPAPGGGWGQPGSQVGPPQQGWGAAPPPAQGGSNNNTPLIIVLVLLLVVAAGGGVYFLTQDDDENGGDDTQETSNGGDLNSNQPDETTIPGGDGVTTMPPTETTVPGSVSATGTPEDAATGFFNAFLSGDCTTAITYITATEIASKGGESGAIADCQQEVSSSLPAGVSFTVDSAVVTSQTDTTASVDLTLTATGAAGTNSDTAAIDLVVEDGAWKISAIP